MTSRRFSLQFYCAAPSYRSNVNTWSYQFPALATALLAAGIARMGLQLSPSESDDLKEREQDPYLVWASIIRRKSRELCFVRYVRDYFCTDKANCRLKYATWTGKWPTKASLSAARTLPTVPGHRRSCKSLLLDKFSCEKLQAAGHAGIYPFTLSLKISLCLISVYFAQFELRSAWNSLTSM